MPFTSEQRADAIDEAVDSLARAVQHNPEDASLPEQHYARWKEAGFDQAMVKEVVAYVQRFSSIAGNRLREICGFEPEARPMSVVLD
jgi:hypothetical protein